MFSCLELKRNHFQSAIRTSKARATYLATIDRDIDAPKRLILSVLLCRNVLAPISVLPPRSSHVSSCSASSYSRSSAGTPCPAPSQLDRRHARLPAQASDPAGRLDAVVADFGLPLAQGAREGWFVVPCEERTARHRPTESGYPLLAQFAPPHTHELYLCRMSTIVLRAICCQEVNHSSGRWRAATGMAYRRSCAVGLGRPHVEGVC